MAVQLRNRLGAGLSLASSASGQLFCSTIRRSKLSRIIFWNCFFRRRGNRPPKTAAAPILDEASVAAMPDAEIERLLLERLGSE